MAALHNEKPFVPQLLPHDDVKWEPLIPLTGAANRALAHYDGVLYGVPNPAVLLSPLTTQEAVLSSRIEGTQATLGDVLKFEAGEGLGRNLVGSIFRRSTTIARLCGRLNANCEHARSISTFAQVAFHSVGQRTWP